MLNWIKGKSKLSFLEHYTPFFAPIVDTLQNLKSQAQDSTKMFLTETSMISDPSPVIDNLKLTIYNEDGLPFNVCIPQDMSLGALKALVVNHFSSQNFKTLSHNSDVAFKTNNAPLDGNYELILVRENRKLKLELSVQSEQLQCEDEILLIEKSGSGNLADILPALKDTGLNYLPDTCTPTRDDIQRETATILPTVSGQSAVNPNNSPSDFKNVLRQILYTMIEVSVYLIATEKNAQEHFSCVFSHLEKRHLPRVDRNALKQLTEMGFPKGRAAKALEIKKNLVEAMEYLLQEPESSPAAADQEEEVAESSSHTEKISLLFAQSDPASAILRMFQEYVQKWFVPDGRAVQNLMCLGYGRDLAKEALKITGNNEKRAMEFLEGKIKENTMSGFSRDSPIMSAILASPIVQVSLVKPKTLFALMVLYESPSNVNVWLSDSATHSVVSQMLRIYHAEKHRLGDPSVPGLTGDASLTPGDSLNITQDADSTFGYEMVVDVESDQPLEGEEELSLNDFRRVDNDMPY